MSKIYAYHVVTGNRLLLNQVITFNSKSHSGLYERVYSKLDLIKDIYSNPDKYDEDKLDEDVRIALRELTFEDVRCEHYKKYPSRLSSLFVCEYLEEAYSWVDNFNRLGRKVLQIVKLEIDGLSFVGDSNNCLLGSTNISYNIEMAKRYWNNEKNINNLIPIKETIVSGKIKVIDIVKDYN